MSATIEELEHSVGECQKVIDHLQFLRRQESPTNKWLLSIGFTNVGTSDWPILLSPKSERGGPVCQVEVDTLMGCDGWKIGDEMITPPNSKWEVVLLLMGLGIEPSFIKEPPNAP
jgi:hypothetical protein